MPPPGEVGGNGGSGGADGGSVVRGEVAARFAGAVLVADFFAGAFLVADFLAGVFFWAAALAGVALGGVVVRFGGAAALRAPADFLADWAGLATVAFFAVVFFVVVFLAVAFLAAGRRAVGAEADAGRGREPLVIQARSAASWSCATTWSVSGL